MAAQRLSNNWRVFSREKKEIHIDMCCGRDLSNDTLPHTATAKKELSDISENAFTFHDTI